MPASRAAWTRSASPARRSRRSRRNRHAGSGRPKSLHHRAGHASFGALPEFLMPARFDLGAKPHLGYTASTLDRATELRQNRAALAALEADPAARIIVIGGELVALRKGAP